MQSRIEASCTLAPWSRTHLEPAKCKYTTRIHIELSFNGRHRTSNRHHRESDLHNHNNTISPVLNKIQIKILFIADEFRGSLFVVSFNESFFYSANSHYFEQILRDFSLVDSHLVRTTFSHALVLVHFVFVHGN